VFSTIVRSLIGLAIIVLGIGAAVTVWLKSAHHPSEAIALAQEFVARLQAHDFARAYELTAKNQLVGRSANEFEQIAQRQFCTVTGVAGTAPFQSNGNRLRRRVYGLEVEMPELQVEFDGRCLFQVTLRHKSHRQWEIYNFQSHAG
jgi:hypothetical protein